MHIFTCICVKNDQLDHKNLKSVKQMGTLSELCRKLQVKNKELSDDLKMAKTSLFNQGISLQFKSDTVASIKKENVKASDKENEQTENQNESKKDEDVGDECVDEEDEACLDDNHETEVDENMKSDKCEDADKKQKIENEQDDVEQDVEVEETNNTAADQAATF